MKVKIVETSSKNIKKITVGIVLIMIVILKQWSLKISPSINLLYFYLTTAVIIMGNKVLLRRIKFLKIKITKH